VALCVSVGADGVLAHPYRTTAYAASDRSLGGGGSLGAVALGRTDRDELSAVRAALTSGAKGRRSVIVLDEIAGLALLAEEPPLGETWSSSLAPDRLAAGIRAACTSRGDASGAPVVLAWRPVPESVTEALAGCGVRLDDASYRETRVTVDGRAVRVFTPRG
jgi:hypothetical protein